VFGLEDNFNNIDELNYSVHVDPDGRFIYFNNPKCACSTVKASINISYAKWKEKAFRYASIAEIHDRRLNFLLSPREVGAARFRSMLDDSGTLKFCFMRDPIERLASAYESKLLWPSPSLRNLAKAVGKPDGWRPSFAEFVSEIGKSVAVRDCDEHWRLQARQLCFGLVDYRFIGDFIGIERSLGALLTNFFGNAATVFDVRKHFSGNNTHSARQIANALPETLHTASESYAADRDKYDLVRQHRFMMGFSGGDNADGTDPA
jgi:hypothetical protein